MVRVTDSAPLVVDLALLGGGGAASLLLAALDRHGVRDLRIAIVDPVRRRGQDRTWAFWGHPDTDLDPLLSASWRQVEVATAARRRVLDLTPLRYAMLRSGPVYDRAADAERRLDATRIVAPAETVRDDGTRVLVRTGDGRAVRAAWCSTPAPARRRERGEPPGCSTSGGGGWRLTGRCSTRRARC